MQWAPKIALYLCHGARIATVTRSVAELGSALRCIRIGSSINEEAPGFDLQCTLLDANASEL